MPDRKFVDIKEVIKHLEDWDASAFIIIGIKLNENNILEGNLSITEGIDRNIAIQVLEYWMQKLEKELLYGS